MAFLVIARAIFPAIAKIGNKSNALSQHRPQKQKVVLVLGSPPSGNSRIFDLLIPLIPVNAAFSLPLRHLIIGTTGVGKSKLAIELASHFRGEVINSDKIQVYKGLNIIVNKVTEEEARGIPHHLLGIVEPDDDFTADDFILHAFATAEAITKRGNLPMIAGGSNSFVKSLIHEDATFKSKYEPCCIWIDVSLPILYPSLSTRVDKMVERGLIPESREFYKPNGNYNNGVRRAIGVPEMHNFFKNEARVNGDERSRLLKDAINKIKLNTNKLSDRQHQKIVMLKELLMWRVHRLDATEVFLKHGLDAERAWEECVVEPSVDIVKSFLVDEE